MPHHEIVVVLVGHFLIAMIWSTIDKILAEGGGVSTGVKAQELIDTLADAFFRAVGIVGKEQ